MRLRTPLLTALVAAALGCAAVAWAGPPCLADIEKLCAKTPAEGGQIQACLKSHEAELSKECKAHVDTLRKTVQDLAATCVWDIERFCGDVAPGGGRIVECLQGHRSDLSPTCRERLGSAKD